MDLVLVLGLGALVWSLAWWLIRPRSPKPRPLALNDTPSQYRHDRWQTLVAPSYPQRSALSVGPAVVAKRCEQPLTDLTPSTPAVWDLTPLIPAVVDYTPSSSPDSCSSSSSSTDSSYDSGSCSSSSSFDGFSGGESSGGGASGEW